MIVKQVPVPAFPRNLWIIMHIFQNLKTYDRPSHQGGLKEPIKEPDSWFDAFKGCLFATALLVGSVALLYSIGSAINSSEIGKDVILIVGVIFVVGLVAFYLGTPVFLTFWAFLGRGKGNHYLKAIVVLILTLLVVGLVLYTCGTMGNSGTDIYEPGKLRPDKF